MSRNRTIVFIVVVVACGVISFVSTRLAATGSQKNEHDGSIPWLAQAAPSVIELEEKFNKEADGLIEDLLQKQNSLALAIEDPYTPDASILAQVEKATASHEHLLRRVGEHVAMLRLKLPAEQRERLMGLCANVIRGPIGQGRGRGYGYGGGRGMGRGQRGWGRGREGGGRGYGQRRGQRGRLAQRLGLTDEQIQITQEQDPDFGADLAQLRNTLFADRENLLSMFEDPQIENETLLKQINRLISSHSRVERRLAQHLLILRPHLNVEQQKWLIGLCRHQGRGY
ncbi:MAG: periplasmic heavy metal sensor [Sedimentisphaerales bacterium]|nr:periplasmic heavy metal sensor [Sedimentisphaerales bacterium]